MISITPEVEVAAGRNAGAQCCVNISRWSCSERSASLCEGKLGRSSLEPHEPYAEAYVERLTKSHCQAVAIIKSLPALQQAPFQVQPAVAGGSTCPVPREASSAADTQLLVQGSKGTHTQSSTSLCSGAVSTTPTRPPGQDFQTSTTTRQCYGRMCTYGTSMTNPASSLIRGSPLLCQPPPLLCP